MEAMRLPSKESTWVGLAKANNHWSLSNEEAGRWARTSAESVFLDFSWAIYGIYLVPLELLQFCKKRTSRIGTRNARHSARVCGVSIITRFIF